MKQNVLIFIPLLALFVFLLLSFQSIYGTGFVYDDRIISMIQHNHFPFITDSMHFFTLLGSGEVIVILTIVIALILFFKNSLVNCLFLLTLTFGGMALNFILKILFQRERPGEGRYIEVFTYSFEIPSYSFPSGHTMRSVILFSFIIYLIFQLVKHAAVKTLLYLLCVMMMILIGTSRIYLGLHYPSDIVSAISISIAWFFICLYFLKNRSGTNKQLLNIR